MGTRMKTMEETSWLMQVLMLCLPSGPFLWRRLSVMQVRQAILYLLVLFSSVGVIYTQDVHRRLLAQQTGVMTVEQQLQREWDKLLLERGAWSNPARVQVSAQHKWGMHTVHTSEIEYLTDVMS